MDLLFENSNFQKVLGEGCNYQVRIDPTPPPLAGYCGTMSGIRFCGCGWVPVEGFFSLFRRETHTKGLRARSPRPEEDDERQGPRAVNKSRGKVTVRERLLLNEELVLVEAELTNVRGWVSVPGGCVGISLRYTDAQKATEKSPNFSLLALGANPSPCLFVLLFVHPFDCECCVLCLCKAMWNAPMGRLSSLTSDDYVLV